RDDAHRRGSARLERAVQHFVEGPVPSHGDDGLVAFVGRLLRQSLRVVRTLGDDGVALELGMPGDQALPDGPRPARTGDRVHDIGDLHTHPSEFTRDGGFEVRASASYAEKERLPPCRSIPPYHMRW